MKTFSIREALYYGFSTALRHIIFFVAAIAVAVGAGLTGFMIFIGINWSAISFFATRMPEICGFLVHNATPSGTDIQLCVMAVMDFFTQHWVFYSGLLFLGFVVLYIIAIYCMLGWMNSLLYIYDHRRCALSSLFVSWRLLLPFIGSSLLYFLAVAGGFILLIIPGIILSLKFGFFGLVLVDKKVGALEALRLSSRITAGAKWKLFLMGLCIGVISGAISLVGSMITQAASAMGAIILLMRCIDNVLSAFLYVVASLAGVYVYRTLSAQTTVPVQIQL
jgi:hypothetical protein